MAKQARRSRGLDQLALAVVDHVLDDLGRPVGELAVLRDELVAGKLLVADFRLGIARDLGLFLAGQAILRGLESAERADHLRVEHDVRLVIGIEVDEGGLGHAELVQSLRSAPCSLSFVEKFRMVMMAKSESNYTEIPNISNKKIRIDTVSAFERRYTFFNGYK